jgi:putative DNA primase/helicase
MSTHIDEAVVRQFIEIISEHVKLVINGAGPPGVLQICRISPIDESVVPSRFLLDDVEHMVKTAIGDAAAGHNVYIEARTVHAGLRGNARGTLADTAWVFGLVADGDADKGKGGSITVRPSLVIETSPGNFHYWYLFTRAIPADQAKIIGDAIRAGTGTDQDTGVITQCYRVAGTPNYPSAAKQARGRITVEPTRIFEQTGRLWDPDELLEAFQPAAGASATTAASPAGGPTDEATLPDDLLKDIRDGGVGKKNDKSRSALFQSVISQLKRRNWSIEAIIELLERYPNGIGAKYQKRLRKEVKRSYAKVAPAASIGVGTATPTASAGTPAGGSAPAPGTAPASQASAAPGAAHILPTIRLVNGQLPRAVEETERALLSAGTAIFSRAGTLVYPVAETTTASDGRRTVMARLRAFVVDSFIEPVAEAAIFQRFSLRQNAWTDIDPPLQLVRMVLSRDRRWVFPRVSGVITTPTLRADGSLLATPGYDLRSELYLLLSLQLPPIPERPTREQAIAALATLKGLFAEFSFQRRELDCSIALSGLLTALLRGSLPTAPVYLIAADTPGTGKSYLVDVIAMIADGRLCPVITASKNVEETEKRLGSMLLNGVSIVSLDNCTHDLGGELLCQITERPVVKIRILGRSEMPDCECHTALFATGNNITFKGDMVRRGLKCNLEALDERPELREFQQDTLEVAAVNRGTYVAAALTIVRAYLAAGSPSVCRPFGSYAAWSRMVRSPLVWLGEPDPTGSLDEIREEDVELTNIREFVGLWSDYELDLGVDYTTTQIIEAACPPHTPNNYSPQTFRQFLLRVAAAKGAPDTVSPDRLGWWLRGISGRIVSITDATGAVRKYRLIRGQVMHRRRACFQLLEI